MTVKANPERIRDAVQTCREHGLDVVAQGEGYWVRGWPIARSTIKWVSAQDDPPDD